MKFCFSMMLIVLLAQNIAAQPSIRLIDSTKKSWMPDGKGTVGLRFRNAGNQPLIITSGKLSSSAKIFNLLTSFTKPKVVAPGDSSYITVEVNAQIAYEYFATIDLISNDPVRPISTFSLRINDSIPPNPVRALTATPLKAGQLSISWQTPSTSRDKDSIVFYRVFIITKDGQSEEIYSGKATSVVAKSKFENDVFVSVLTYDDMGNRSVSLDTTWIDRSKPIVRITQVDPQLEGVPEHIERGRPHFDLDVRDWHMGKLDIYWREPGSSQLNLIDQATNFPQFKEDHRAGFNWNTSQLRGKKEIVLISRDAVDNADTAIYSFTVSQIKGWPKRMINHPFASAVTIAGDEGGRFLMTGADIANGVFRPNGHHYFYNWPLDITRASNERVLTAAADLDHDNTSEIIALNRSKLSIFDHHGMIESEFSGIGSGDRYASILQQGDSTYILSGVSPVAVRDETTGAFRTYGVSGSWYSKGASAALSPGLIEEGVREKDRFAIANLLAASQEAVVQVHDNGISEQLIIRTPSGDPVVGPIEVWRSPTPYNGFYPSIGDIDGDNALDIVIPAANDSICAYHKDGTLIKGYPVHAMSSTSGRNQAMLADVDRDGASDIILPVDDSIIAISGKSAAMIRSNVWPIKRKAPGTSYLTIADLNSDGYLELLESPTPGDTSWVYAYDLDVRNDYSTIEWGTFQHDMMRSGNYNTRTPELRSGVSQTASTEPAILHGRYLQLNRSGRVRILDILGRDVLSIAAESEQSIDLSNLPTGVYIVDIDELQVIKIIL